MNSEAEEQFEFEEVIEEEKARAVEAVEQYKRDLEKYKDSHLSDEDKEKFNAPWGPW
ncbi:hypothetical protein IU459_01950 [Nocardia amamiensis]|uniref:Uncharacterized protein n=1 Tax=Nocardia amamiensis TaxID=404578 RepID=A0ABS0CI77_9NOCA|nr:hypothetical protein [Nocardia amamiensis]MBF6296304.1 hypothetical protein [Nocardia amamiensis]